MRHASLHQEGPAVSVSVELLDANPSHHVRLSVADTVANAAVKSRGPVLFPEVPFCEDCGRRDNAETPQ